MASCQSVSVWPSMGSMPGAWASTTSRKRAASSTSIRLTGDDTRASPEYATWVWPLTPLLVWMMMTPLAPRAP